MNERSNDLEGTARHRGARYGTLREGGVLVVKLNLESLSCTHAGVLVLVPMCWCTGAGVLVLVPMCWCTGARARAFPN